MATYTPCTGSGAKATEARTMNTTGSGAKFFHLHGRRTGSCAECGKSLMLGQRDIAPAHKAR